MMESMIKARCYPRRGYGRRERRIGWNRRVMLSAETAAGDYPIETVKAMAEVCVGAEKMPSINVSNHRLNKEFELIEETISMASMYAANHMPKVKAMVALTESGKTL